MLKSFKILPCLAALALFLSAAPPEASAQISGALTATSANCATASSCLVFNGMPSSGTVGVQVIGTFTATGLFEGSGNGATYDEVSCTAVDGSGNASSFTAAGIWQCPVSGLTGFRVRLSAYTSGSAEIWLSATPASSGSGGGTLPTLEDILTELEEIRDLLASTDPVGVLPKATATGGTSGCAIVSAASTNATSCATAAGGFYGFDITNTTTTLYYLRLYNTAGAPTCSSATGFIRSIALVPAAAAGGVGGNYLSLSIPNTGSFTTGIGYCITAGSSSTDNTNAAVGLLGEIRYKQ